ncbi:hypothetical protein JCM10908_001118 [Rhodotorula pacifica]|uniref:uncharacterized protein n=1 Tax=Rhodotorula pacifica TaxID=1495444 RepID=UPI00317D6CC6
MLLFGLALRHGWGCKADQQRGVTLFKAAASTIAGDIECMVQGRGKLGDFKTKETGARTELALALYELGVSYRFGWGVQRSKRTAARYFALAAELGDADAQRDFEHCTKQLLKT